MNGAFDLPTHLKQETEQRGAEANRHLSGLNAQHQLLASLGLSEFEGLRASYWDAYTKHLAAVAGLVPELTGPAAATDFAAYAKDAAQRLVLFFDTLRERGNSYIEREAEGFKPVLVFDYEMVVDGRTLARPVNYALVRILPPEGYPPQREDGRPFVIIDPRAGHGSGIGGYKSDSEVGVALKDGHPVYFVIFFPDPEPGQTLADITAAEAHFLETVIERHKDASKPLVTGNCQGGWASMLLAATHPDLPGPIVVAGAPMSYWAGTLGRNPLRYNGGLFGGIVPALFSADLGNGRFDGANLVLNFESLNPANTWWRKYYDLFADVDEEAPRYLEFERWWSGFYFMNEAEIRWIVENLFIGNKLTKGEAILDDGQLVDLKRITSPIVVFASHGDNITPPEQALFWIADLYESSKEIMARGQVIIYTLHDSVGHLGIFVSSGVARKQHKQITSTVKTIEALSPGLYEMIITEGPDRTHVAFEPREVADVLALGSPREQEQAFATVARLSEWSAEAYEMFMRPAVKAMVTPELAAAISHNHPLRRRRYFFSDENPMFAALAPVADTIHKERAPSAESNPFREIERAQAEMIETSWNLFRDMRDIGYELTFRSIYEHPLVKAWGRLARPKKAVEDFRQIPAVRDAVARAGEGGYAEALIRMFILMARARGSVRRSRLERSNEIIQAAEPFNTMSAAERSRIIQEQTLIVQFAPEEAATTLPSLIQDEEARQKAIDLVFEVAGPLDEMSPPTIAMFQQLQFLLDTRATHWCEPEYEVTPFTEVPPATANAAE